MDIEQLNSLSYKELQAHAKQLSIAANQKKEILIQEIVARGDVNDENSSFVANSVVKVQVVPVTPLSKPTRMTRSTAKKAQVVEVESEVEQCAKEVDIRQQESAEVMSCNMASPGLAVDVSEPADYVLMESSKLATPFEATKTSPSTACKNTVSFANTIEMGPAGEESEEYDDEEEAEYPNPTNLFDAEEDLEQDLSALELSPQQLPQGPKIAINRHVYFTSPDAKGNLVEVAAIEEGAAKHMHFASPDLSMGSAVHWTYDEYAANNGSNSSAVEQLAQEREDDAQSEASEMEAAEQQRMKLPVGHNDRVMNFWLTKAFAQPSSNFFK